MIFEKRIQPIEVPVSIDKVERLSFLIRVFFPLQMSKLTPVATFLLLVGYSCAADQYWWRYPGSDCGYDDVPGQPPGLCEGNNVAVCKAKCLNISDSCGGFNTHGILKKKYASCHAPYRACLLGSSSFAFSEFTHSILFLSFSFHSKNDTEIACRVKRPGKRGPVRA